MTTTPPTSPQPPEGHEILPAPFLRQYGIPANAKWRRTNVNTQWYDASVPRGSDYYPADAEKELTDYIWCAPLGTMAAATTPLPVRECDCGTESSGIGEYRHHPRCSIHLPPYRHILPGALAALSAAGEPMPEGLICRWREGYEGSTNKEWGAWRVWPFTSLDCLDKDIVFAIPAPLEKGENHMSRATLDQLEPGAFEEPRWHNPDNLPSAGEPPWRFLVEGERPKAGDEFFGKYLYTSPGDWGPFTEHDARNFKPWFLENTYRTRRPLPAPSVPAGQAEDEDKCEDCDPSFTCWGNESQCRKRPKTITKGPATPEGPTDGEMLQASFDGNRPLPFDRDTLGQHVRDAWIRWAKTQPNPKPSWLVPYDQLSEPDKEADRQIGEHIARLTLVGDAAFRSLAADARCLAAAMKGEGK